MLRQKHTESPYAHAEAHLHCLAWLRMSNTTIGILYSKKKYCLRRPTSLPHQSPAPISGLWFSIKARCHGNEVRWNHQSPRAAWVAWSTVKRSMSGMISHQALCILLGCTHKHKVPKRTKTYTSTSLFSQKLFFVLNSSGEILRKMKHQPQTSILMMKKLSWK